MKAAALSRISFCLSNNTFQCPNPERYRYFSFLYRICLVFCICSSYVNSSLLCLSVLEEISSNLWE